MNTQLFRILFLFLFLFLFFSNLLLSQFNLVSFLNEFPETIEQVVIGDPDADGKENIYVLVNASSLIYKLSFENNKLSRKIYTSVPNRDKLFFAHLNNDGEDILFSVKNKNGLTVFYGKDEDNKELVTAGIIGENELNGIKNVEGLKGQANSPLYPNVIGVVLLNNMVSYWRSQSSSFNIISSAKISSVQYTDDIISSASFIESNTAYNMLHLTSNNEIYIDRIDAKNFAFKLEPSKKLDIKITNGKKMHSESGLIYILDSEEKKIIQYNPITKVIKDVPFNLTDEVIDFKVLKFDNNDKLDLLLITKNEIWVLTDFGQKRSDAEKLITESDLIDNVFVLDINGDGFSEVSYFIKGSKSLKTVQNDFISSVDEKDLVGLISWPNPFTDVINFNRTIEKVEVYDIGAKLIFSAEGVDNISLGFLTSGQYLLKCIEKDKIVSNYINKQ